MALKAVVGTKADLEEQREVSSEEAAVSEVDFPPFLVAHHIQSVFIFTVTRSSVRSMVEAVYLIMRPASS